MNKLISQRFLNFFINNSIYNELEAAKGKDYLNKFIRKLSNEYKVSEYVLSNSEQKILDKILIEYKVKVKIKV